MTAGVTRFFGESTGGNAQFITNAGGIVDISGLGTFPDGGGGPNAPGMTAGSIDGAGTYFLGSKQLTVGSNNLSTVVSGVIEDGGSSGGVGGSLVKVGTGTLTIDGAGTYTGGTTVSGGTLVVGDFANPSAALSGGGPITVGSGGTLGGYGSVTGDVTNSGVIAPGSATQLSGSPMGGFTIKGNYAGAGGTMAINTVLGGDELALRPIGHQRRLGQRQHDRARDQCRWCGCGNDQRHSGGERGQRGHDRSWGVRPSRWRTPRGRLRL